MRDEQKQFRDRNVITLGVNPATVASHEKYAQGFKFNFKLASDPDRLAARAYRALKPDGKGILRTVYLIGKDGHAIKRFGSNTEPRDLAPGIEAAL